MTPLYSPFMRIAPPYVCYAPPLCCAFSAAAYTLLTTKLMPDAKAYFQSVLKVRSPVSGNLSIPVGGGMQVEVLVSPWRPLFLVRALHPTPPRQFVSDDAFCPHVCPFDPLQRSCGNIIPSSGRCLEYDADTCYAGATAFPPECIAPYTLCTGNSESLCTSSPAGGAGCPNADILIIASVKSAGCAATTIAYAGTCRLDAVSDRPLVAMVNFCPAYLKDPSASYRYMLKVRPHGCACNALAFPGCLTL